MLGFLRRYQVLVSSGMLLLVAVMLISANARRGERVDPLGRLVLEAIYPFQLGVTQLVGGAYDIWHGYLELVGIRAEAEALRQRVGILKGELTRLAEIEEANKRLRRLLELRRAIGMRLVAARVIGWDASLRDRTITLDKGERDGVFSGAAVLVPEGVVGQVFRASRDAARVLLISDRNSGVDAIVQRSRVRGILQGRHGGCDLKYVKRGAEVREGDHIVTSGLDGVFPKGVLLGDVLYVNTPKRGLFQTIVVEPRVEFDHLEEVLVTIGREPSEARDEPTDEATDDPADRAVAE